MRPRPRGPAQRQAKTDSHTPVGTILELVCLYDGCPLPGGVFRRTAKKGPRPSYCSDACRQGAYRLRVAGVRVGERRRSTAPSRAGHRIQLTIPVDVMLALSQEAWANCEGTATAASRILTDAVRAKS